MQPIMCPCRHRIGNHLKLKTCTSSLNSFYYQIFHHKWPFQSEIYILGKLYFHIVDIQATQVTVKWQWASSKPTNVAVYNLCASRCGFINEFCTVCSGKDEVCTGGTCYYIDAYAYDNAGTILAYETSGVRYITGTYLCSINLYNKSNLKWRETKWMTFSSRQRSLWLRCLKVANGAHSVRLVVGGFCS